MYPITYTKTGRLNVTHIAKQTILKGCCKGLGLLATLIRPKPSKAENPKL